MKGALAFVGVLMAVVPSAGWTQAPSCPFLPQYQRLQADVARRGAPPAEVVRALYAYAGDPANENPIACEAIALDRQIAERERALVTLVTSSRVTLAADTAFHCSAPDPRTMQCDGIVADGTGQPDAVRIRPASPIRTMVTARLANGLPGARLIGLYRTTPADIGAGKPAVRLKAGQPIMLAPRAGGSVLIALLTAPAPYKVRKLVWYY